MIGRCYYDLSDFPEVEDRNAKRFVNKITDIHLIDDHKNEEDKEYLSNYKNQSIFQALALLRLFNVDLNSERSLQ